MLSCMGGEESRNVSDIELVIYYDETAGMIQEYPERSASSIFRCWYHSIMLTKSSAGEIESFYFEAGDGSSRIAVDTRPER